MRNLVTMVVGLAFAASAHAIDVAGVSIADKTSVGGQDLVLNGAGVRTRAIFKGHVQAADVHLEDRPRRSRRRAMCTRSRRGACSSTCCATCRPSSWSMP